jgi:hypothetical protein
MLVKKFSLTSTQINSGTPNKINVQIADPLHLTAAVWSPKEIIVVNNSGADLGITYLSDDTEDTLRTSDVTLFAPIPISSGKSNSSLPFTKYVVITTLSGLATTGIDLYLLGYC